jgi:hypothetical protein
MRHGADSGLVRFQALMPGPTHSGAITDIRAVSTGTHPLEKLRSDARHGIVVSFWCPNDDTGSNLA